MKLQKIKAFIGRKKTLLIIGVIGFMVFILLSKLKSEDVPVVVQATPEVELFELGQTDISLEALCRVTSDRDIELIAKQPGEIKKVFVKDGDQVKEGQLLLELKNTPQRASLADAQVGIDSAKLALAELNRQNQSNTNGSLFSQVSAQQGVLVESARINYLNNELSVIPQDSEDRIRTTKPTVEGSYTCQQEGEYIIEMYGSNANSGASFRFSGLESGKASAVTNGFGSALGACGLRLNFDANIDKNEVWVLKVPNTDAATYSSVKSNYLATKEGKNITLNQTEVSPERLKQAQGQLNQARLRYQVALDALENTKIRAQYDGVISGLDLIAGDTVSAYTPLGSLRNDQKKNIEFYLDQESVTGLSRESLVYANDVAIGSVSHFSKLPDTQTNKVRVIAELFDEEYQVGESFTCVTVRDLDLSAERGLVKIPLSSVAIVGIDPYVFQVNDGVLERTAIQVATLQGQDVLVEGLNDISSVVRDARGLQVGASVTIKE